MAAVPSTSELSSLELRHRRNYVKFLHQHRYDHNHAPSACLNAYLSVYTHTNSSANLRGVFQALVRGALLLGDQAFLTPSTNLVVTRHINYLQRLYPHQIRRAPPMLWSDLKLILEELQPLQCIKNLSTALLLRACFENGLRCGDALRLKSQDVLLEPDGRIRISLPYTKTCRTPVQFVYHHTGEPYCFVALLYHFRKKMSIHMEAGTILVLCVASWQAIFQSNSYPSLRWNPSSECFQSRRATEKVQRSSWSI